MNSQTTTHDGWTHVKVTADPDSVTWPLALVGVGESTCSDQDQYDEITGFMIAFGRACQDFGRKAEAEAKARVRSKAAIKADRHLNHVISQSMEREIARLFKKPHADRRQILDRREENTLPAGSEFDHRSGLADRRTPRS